MRRALKLKLKKLYRQLDDLKRQPFNPKGKEERLERARQDDFYFYETYLPMWHTCQPSNFHRELAAAFDIRNELQAYAAPRHHGKTISWMSKGIKNMIFHDWPWLLGVGASKELIGDLVEPMRAQFTGNFRLMQDFNDGQPLCGGGSDTDFTLWNKTRFDACGRRQAKRGIHPTAIIFDDIEDDEQAQSREQVKKLFDRLIEVFYPMLPPDTEGGGVFCDLGTILSRKSMLYQILIDEEPYIEDMPEFIGKVYRAIMTDETTGEEYSLFPQRYPLATLQRIRERMGRLRFEKEFQNNPRDDSNVFLRKWMRGFAADEFQAACEAVA